MTVKIADYRVTLTFAQIGLVERTVNEMLGRLGAEPTTEVVECNGFSSTRAAIERGTLFFPHGTRIAFGFDSISLNPLGIVRVLEQPRSSINYTFQAMMGMVTVTGAIIKWSSPNWVIQLSFSRSVLTEQPKPTKRAIARTKQTSKSKSPNVVPATDTFAQPCSCGGNNPSCFKCGGWGYLDQIGIGRSMPEPRGLGLKARSHSVRNAVISTKNVVTLSKCPECGVMVRRLIRHLRKVHSRLE